MNQSIINVDSNQQPSQKQQNEVQNEDKNSEKKKMYSLKDMFTLDKSKIEKRIFKMQIETDTELSSSKNLVMNSSKKSDQVIHRYLQIKKQQ